MTAGLAAAGLIGGLAAAVAAGMLFAACQVPGEFLNGAPSAH